jgi:diaminohydroxyphosphoribosylaminopyrimidine deaminase/5-amino-6-(5-phosphoribosylamino)uracil reductase
MRDPHPRVNGAGVRILREKGLEVLEGVREREIRRQLGSWVINFHPHELVQRARSLEATMSPQALLQALVEIYAVDLALVERSLRTLDGTWLLKGTSGS